MLAPQQDFSLETERLIIREWRAQDWPEFIEHNNRPNVMAWLGGVLDDKAVLIMQERFKAYRREHGFTFWPVIRKNDGGHLSSQVLGFCGLKRANQAGGPQGDPEIGWRFREDSWGRGYAKEAAIAVRDYAFETLNLPHILALTVEENIASWGLMRRIGMERAEELDFGNDEFGAEQIIVYRLDQNSRKEPQ